MATTYTPLVGDNLIDSFVNATPAAIAKTAGQGDGRPGRMRCAFTLQNSAVNAAADLTLTLQIKSPIDIDTTVEGLADLASYAPACNISLKSAATIADAAPMLPRISAGPATVEGLVPVVIKFVEGLNATAAEFNVDIDFSHSVAN